MPERILFPQWQKQNEPTKYPFAEYATLRNETGRFLIEGTFLDAALYPIGAGARVYLSQVRIDFQKVEMKLASPGQPDLATGEFSLIAPPEQVAFYDAYGRPAGMLLSESQRLSVFQSWGVGTHEFLLEETEFAATCVFPTPEVGVRGIRLESGEVFVGDVWLVGDDGVVLQAEEFTLPVPGGCTTRTVQAIRVDVVGDPLFRRRLCEDANLFTTPRFVKKLAIVGSNMSFDLEPDSNGHIRMTSSGDLAAHTVLRLKTTPDGIEIGAVGSTITT